MSMVDTNEVFYLTSAQAAYEHELMRLVLASSALAGAALHGEEMPAAFANSVICRTFLNVACLTAYNNAIACNRAPDRELWLIRCAQAFDAIAVAKDDKGAPKTTAPNEGLVEKIEKAKHAKAQGFSGDACTRCGNFTLKRAGTCLTCQACGETTGCS